MFGPLCTGRMQSGLFCALPIENLEIKAPEKSLTFRVKMTIVFIFRIAVINFIKRKISLAKGCA